MIINPLQTILLLTGYLWEFKRLVLLCKTDPRPVTNVHSLLQKTCAGPLGDRDFLKITKFEIFAKR